MTRLTWDAVGERIFEIGVDRGVLFVEGSDGVPWNGLVSIQESPSGSDSIGYYIDGVQYAHASGAEDFQATLTAYTYPDEFEKYAGDTNGLYTPRTQRGFGLAYRSMVESDISNPTNPRYKIHLIYDAVAVPDDRTSQTNDERLNPTEFVWTIFTKARPVEGFAPSAHFIVDSVDVPEGLLKDFEDILYGTDEGPSRLPSVEELVILFDKYRFYIDAGYLGEPYDTWVDAGHISEPQEEFLDGGGP